MQLYHWNVLLVSKSRKLHPDSHCRVTDCEDGTTVCDGVTIWLFLNALAVTMHVGVPCSTVIRKGGFSWFDESWHAIKDKS